MHFWRNIFFYFTIVLVEFFLLSTTHVFAALSPWTQTNWAGGSGQTSFTDSTKYSSGSNINSGTANQVSLSQNIGSGNDGAITVSSNKNINSDNMISGRSCSDGGDAVNYSVTANVSSGVSSITLSSTPSSGCLVAGDEILIINLQGTSGDNANVGKYETATIQSISTATLTLTSTLSNAYNGTTQKIMVQRVPNYTNVTVNGATTLTANAWNGTKNGVLFFRANGTVTVTGSISGNALGFRGGTGAAPSGSNVFAQQGEGYVAGQTNSGSTNNGGGGGGNSNRSGNNDTTGAGGGGYGSSGGTGENKGGGAANPNGGGIGGATYGTSSLSTMFLGGGGGAGGGSDSGCTLAAGGNGGTGGGIVFVQAGTLTVTGSITATGGNGIQPGTTNCSGSGGGGAGGSINISGSSITLGSSIVTSTGGSGGGSITFAGAGGAGGNGRIAVYSSGSVSGTTNPTYATGSVVFTYASSGTLTSSIFDSEISNVVWGTLNFNATTPNNTTATVKVRTGNQSDLSDATAFSSCSAISNGANASSNACAANLRYAQYQIALSTSDTSTTAAFTSFSLAFASPTPTPTPTSIPSSNSGNSGSSSNNSNSSTCSTTPPSGSPNLYKIDSSTGSVILYFTPVSGASGYNIAYGTDTVASQYGVTFSNSETNGAISYVINGLNSGTTYYFKVNARNGCASGNWSTTKSATTNSSVSLIKTVQNVIKEEADTVAEKVAAIPILEKTLDKKIVLKKKTISSKPSFISYVVKTGDSLWTIAKDVLGAGTEYAKIMQQNISKYPNIASNLKVGSELTIKKEDPPQIDKKISKKTYDLDVKILASNTKPLEGVAVTLHSTPQTKTTDKKGIAHFKNVEGGKHTVYLAYNGYDGGGQSINVTGDNKNIDLVMQVDLNASFTTITFIVIGILIIVIIVLFFYIYKKRLYVAKKK